MVAWWKYSLGRHSTLFLLLLFYSFLVKVVVVLAVLVVGIVPVPGICPRCRGHHCGRFCRLCRYCCCGGVVVIIIIIIVDVVIAIVKLIFS